MSEDTIPPERGIPAATEGRDRAARLAAAMRANLQRRKRQRRARELEAGLGPDAGTPPVEQG